MTIPLLSAVQSMPSLKAAFTEFANDKEAWEWIALIILRQFAEKIKKTDTRLFRSGIKTRIKRR